ncbi:MAG: hypothetical protein KatS3mg118_2881 [Paracoccaceae bacterium]|nr:MAG: hypothetical protein KatS3mg118_2881 [Paracoccaceae bacterium]
MRARPPALPPMTLVTCAPQTVFGLSRRLTAAIRAEIPALWAELGRRHGAELCGRETLGIVHDFDRSGGFTYLAGFAADPDLAPADLVRFDLPGGRHACFAHPGPVETIGESWGAIMAGWHDGLPVRMAPGPAFERYAPDFDPARPGGVEILIPVLERG